MKASILVLTLCLAVACLVPAASAAPKNPCDRENPPDECGGSTPPPPPPTSCGFGVHYPMPSYSPYGGHIDQRYLCVLP